MCRGVCHEDALELPGAAGAERVAWVAEVGGLGVRGVWGVWGLGFLEGWGVGEFECMRVWRLRVEGFGRFRGLEGWGVCGRGNRQQFEHSRPDQVCHVQSSGSFRHKDLALGQRHRVPRRSKI